jgi:hypothetical protein
MRIIEVKNAGKNHRHPWATGDEIYSNYIEYIATDEEGDHSIIIGYTIRDTYDKTRMKIVVFIDKYPYAEFVGADDFAVSGDVLSEIKISTADDKMEMCRYPNGKVPAQYIQFQVEGLPNRINAKGVHNAWCVVSNISDHKTLIALAALRKKEKKSLA